MKFRRQEAEGSESQQPAKRIRNNIEACETCAQGKVSTVKASAFASDELGEDMARWDTIYQTVNVSSLERGP